MNNFRIKYLHYKRNKLNKMVTEIGEDERTDLEDVSTKNYKI